MDRTDLMIETVEAGLLPKVVVKTNEGKIFVANLDRFKSVYCFPKNQEEWENVSVSTGGYALRWGSDFEVHIDQLLASCEQQESNG